MEPSSAGLYAAEQLAQAGWQVGVFERATALTTDRRTLIITPQLQRLVGAVPETVWIHSSQCMVAATAQTHISIAFQYPDLIVERWAFIQMLAQRAEQVGASIHYGYRFQHVAAHSKGMLLTLMHAKGQTQVQTHALIGADGAFSSVATAVGLEPPPTVPILQAEVRLPTGWNPSTSQVWFDRADTRFFYWLVPESDEHGVVGLIGDERAQTRMLLQRFLNKLDVQPLTYQAAQVALYHPRLRPWAQVGSAPVLLVGDAAGQVKATTVGGTVSGLWGAQSAVRAFVRGTPYHYELQELNRDLYPHWCIHQLLDRLDTNGYNTLINHINHPVQHLLSQRNRDEMAMGFWQICLLQPRFIPLGLRLLAKVLRGLSTHRPTIHHVA